MAGTMSVGGLASGLDTEGIIGKLEALAKQPITRMQSQKSTIQNQQSAWQDISSRLLSIKEKASAMSKLGGGGTMVAATTDNAITASAGAGAVVGQYALTVNKLSTNHQLISQVYSDADTTSLGTGTYSITANGKTTNIDVHELTLTGLRDAINLSDANVTAFIVKNNNANQLVLSAKTAGTAGSITINSTLAGGVAPTLSTLQVANDTEVVLGSGANKVTFTRTGTTLTDIIPGLTLSLSQVSEGKTATINVTSSNSDVRTAVNGVVTQVNSFLEMVTQYASYDSKTGATGVLFGNARLATIKNELLSTITNVVGGLPDSMRTAVQAGIRLTNEGRLTFDTAAIDAAMTENRDAVVRLFSTMGQSSNTAIKYLGSTSDTQVSNASGYAVDITQAAERARLTIGGAELPATLAQNETLTINDITVEVTAGMTRAQVLTAINAKMSDSRVAASLTGADGVGTGNYLTFTQVDYGATQYVKVQSSVAAGGTGVGTTQISAGDPGTGNVGHVGKDVQGTINGAAATGSGQMLTSSTGAAKGLQLQITATAAGSYGNVVFTHGVGGSLDRMLDFVTRSGDGTISNILETLDNNVSSLDESITRETETVAREMTRMRAQFNAMEVALSTMKNQSAQLTNLIAQLPSYSSAS